MKSNASEPLMTCRKRKDDVKTAGFSLPWDKSRQCLFMDLGGIRHGGGESMILALVWNVGTCRSDVKGDIRGVIPQGSEYRCGAQGRSNL